MLQMCTKYYNPVCAVPMAYKKQTKKYKWKKLFLCKEKNVYHRVRINISQFAIRDTF